MEKVLLQQNRHWKGEYYKGIYDRDIMKDIIKKLSIREIMVFLGVRRSGKSTLFHLLINYLMKTTVAEKILYINFDDPYYADVYRDAKNIYNIVETAEKLTQKKAGYLFLDEIQNVDNWEKFVKSVYDSKVFKKIFITGSNSAVVEGEYASLLSGRYVVDVVHPFSFSEILKTKGIDNYVKLIESKPLILSIVDTLLEFGGFPEVFKNTNTELKREILISYYETIVFKDCIARGKIRNIKTFRELTNYILSNSAALYSYNSVARAVGSNDISVKEFIRILESSFLLRETSGFSFSLKEQIRNKKKIYCVDNGILSNISFRFSSNKGKLFENLVFTELVKRKNKIYFFHENKECDFIVQDNNGLRAVQVCYEINESNRKRELAGIHAACSKFDISEGVIITYDQEESFESFDAVPFWKFFYE